jgi:hypothetical protein
MSWITDLFSWFGHKNSVSIKNISELHIVPAWKEKSALPPGIEIIPSQERKILSRGLGYFSVPDGQTDWLYPQYDHYEVEVIFDIESFAGRALRAKLGLFLKEGYEFVGKNDEKVSYIRTRFDQIGRATGIPLDILLYQTCTDLIKHSNAYWLKVRKNSASGGKIRRSGNKRLLPVAGYFSLPPETMVPEIDNAGNITRWKQVIGDLEKIYSKDDIVHFYTNKKAGYALGVPSIWASIDDVRALRSIEANLDVLIHKHLFPILLWKVGTPEAPAQAYSNGDTEIEVVQHKIARMPAEGSIVVSERYNVEAIGVENKALKVEAYLDHFKERLLAGLDVSAIDVGGTGGSGAASRSTAQTLSQNLMDNVKMHQIVVQKFLEPVISELFLESTFDQDTIFDTENSVTLRFHEIDKQAKIASENHITDLFLKNIITHNEARQGMGRDPLKPEEEAGLYWWKIGREMSLISSIDELSGNSVDGDKAISNKNNPQNQYGSRGSPKLNKDNFFCWMETAEIELQRRWIRDGSLVKEETKDFLSGIFSLATEDFSRQVKKIIRQEYPSPLKISILAEYIDSKNLGSLARLQRDLLVALSKGQSPSIVFQSMRYRFSVLLETGISRARNISKLLLLQELDGRTSIDFQDFSDPKLTLDSWNDKLEQMGVI